jgi:hypothetical protein
MSEEDEEEGIRRSEKEVRKEVRKRGWSGGERG